MSRWTLSTKSQFGCLLWLFLASACLEKIPFSVLPTFGPVAMTWHLCTTRGRVKVSDNLIQCDSVTFNA